MNKVQKDPTQMADIEPIHHRWRPTFRVLIWGSCLLLIWAFFIPFSNPVCPGSKTQFIVIRGRAIYLSIMESRLDDSLVGPQPLLPNSEKFATSTDYFKYLIEEKFLPPDFSLFEYPGAKSTVDSIEEFTAEHNMWSVVADLDSGSPPGVPLLVSCNVIESHLTDGVDPQTTTHILVTKDRRFDDKVILVNMAGAAGALRGKNEMIWENLNPTENTNRILHP